MMEVPVLMTLTSIRSSTYMRLWHQAVPQEREPLNSVWLYLKVLVGTLPTILMLIITSMDKDKDAISFSVPAAPLLLHSMSSVLDPTEDALLKDIQVDSAAVMKRLTDADMLTQATIIIAKTLMMLITQDFPLLSPMVEKLAVDALLVV